MQSGKEQYFGFRRVNTSSDVQLHQLGLDLLVPFQSDDTVTFIFTAFSAL